MQKLMFVLNLINDNRPVVFLVVVGIGILCIYLAKGNIRRQVTPVVPSTRKDWEDAIKTPRMAWPWLLVGGIISSVLLFSLKGETAAGSPELVYALSTAVFLSFGGMLFMLCSIRKIKQVYLSQRQ